MLDSHNVIWLRMTGREKKKNKCKGCSNTHEVNEMEWAGHITRSKMIDVSQK